ncbi:TetR/AcrR family transcriptional regulator [Undibacterium sp. Jales W-56]|uniref:TetR/AcrR family transcriptional regulator n=1 Tax=Undibacterium sp. Jales W-56 TaxID=2897325 RepID=UPI0021D14663|nr:TetR/AcrR family transcriptional regulator [Undibacterium sp. Jales W-56]MCU6434662.1 TetR/AcrR family transcriptional regulator [Undibacterium sp. Jales W-56]
MSCPFKPRWERRKDARPQELLSAALDLFVDRGFAATRLDDVARAAGVSKGTLYLYYSSKEELFKAVVRENVLPLIDEAGELIQAFSGSTADLFRLFMTTWWERMGKTKLSGLSKLMMAEASNFPDLAQFYHDEVIAPGDAMIVGMLRRGIASGEMRAIDPEIGAKILIAPMIMMMMWKHSYSVCQIPTKDLENYLEHYIDMALHGLLVR